MSFWDSLTGTSNSTIDKYRENAERQRGLSKTHIEAGNRKANALAEANNEMEEAKETARNIAKSDERTKALEDSEAQAAAVSRQVRRETAKTGNTALAAAKAANASNESRDKSYSSNLAAARDRKDRGSEKLAQIKGQQSQNKLAAVDARSAGEEKAAQNELDVEGKLADVSKMKDERKAKKLQGILGLVGTGISVAKDIGTALPAISAMTGPSEASKLASASGMSKAEAQRYIDEQKRLEILRQYGVPARR